MYSNMCAKIALSLALLGCVNANVLKYPLFHQELVNSEDLIKDIAVNSELQQYQSITSMKHDSDEEDNNMVFTITEEVLEDFDQNATPDTGSIFENRVSIDASSCPNGYTKIKGRCIKDSADMDY